MLYIAKMTIDIPDMWLKMGQYLLSTVSFEREDIALKVVEYGLKSWEYTIVCLCEVRNRSLDD